MIDRTRMAAEVAQINYHRGQISWIRFFKVLDGILELDDRYEEELGEEDTQYTVDEVVEATTRLEHHKARLQRYYETRRNDIRDGEFDVIEHIVDIIRESYR